MGLKVYHNGFKPTSSLEWQSVVAFEIETNVNLMVQMKERLEAPLKYFFKLHDETCCSYLFVQDDSVKHVQKKHPIK